MGIALNADTPFFPNVYNEDLLFAWDDISRAVAIHVGSLRQVKEYDPLRNAGAGSLRRIWRIS